MFKSHCNFLSIFPRNAEALKLLDRLLKNYDRRSTPTNNMGKTDSSVHRPQSLELFFLYSNRQPGQSGNLQVSFHSISLQKERNPSGYVPPEARNFKRTDAFLEGEGGGLWRLGMGPRRGQTGRPEGGSV